MRELRRAAELRSAVRPQPPRANRSVVRIPIRAGVLVRDMRSFGSFSCRLTSLRMTIEIICKQENTRRLPGEQAP